MTAKRRVLLTSCLLQLLVGVAFCFLLHGKDNVHEVNIDLQTPISRTGPRFIGVDIGIPLLLSGNMSRLVIHDPKLLALTRAYSPCYMRVGGTAADRLVFDPHRTKMHNFTFGTYLWNHIHAFANLSGWDVIFDFNVLYRKAGHWDPSNARQLLQYSQDRGYNIPCFQLGNEPTVFNNTFHTWVPPESLAQDYLKLRSVLNEFPLYRNSCVLGPETISLHRLTTRKFFITFLESGGAKALSAIGMHHYNSGFNHKPATIDYFFAHEHLDELENALDLLTSVRDRLAPGKPLWLSETGTVMWTIPNCDQYRLAYIDGFLWLDKLGLSAKHGLQHVNRQQFFSILVAGTTDFTPYPDYFLTLLHKRLVQGPVFKVLTSTPTVRVYAHCANPASYSKGAVTVYVINLENVNVTLGFAQFNGQQVDIYMLTPGDRHGLLSKLVALNEKPLVMSGNHLPPLPPKHVTGPVTMAARSFGFIVFPHANVHACK